MSTENQIKLKEVLNPFYLEAGWALYACQHFEYSVSFLLFHLSRVGAEHISVAQARAILDGDSKKTAGQLIKLLKENAKLDTELENYLVQALDARNNIAHRFLIKNVERLANHQQRASVLDELKNLHKKIRLAIDVLDPIIRNYMKTIDGITLNENIIEEMFTFVDSSDIANSNSGAG